MLIRTLVGTLLTLNWIRGSQLSAISNLESVQVVIHKVELPWSIGRFEAPIDENEVHWVDTLGVNVDLCILSDTWTLVSSNWSKVEAIKVNEDAILGDDWFERAVELLLEEEDVWVDPELLDQEISLVWIICVQANWVEGVGVHCEFYFERHQGEGQQFLIGLENSQDPRVDRNTPSLSSWTLIQVTICCSTVSLQWSLLKRLILTNCSIRRRKVFVVVI